MARNSLHDIDRDTLHEARKHPEKYKDLLVKVAGYSARLVQLGRPMQDEIIGRTEHEVVV